MTLAELNNLIITSLTPVLGAGEARATARLLLEDDLGVSPTTLVLRGDRVLEPETESRFARYIRDIAAGMPPQYAVGKARFMGMSLKVTPSTLIPRPETAMLVDIITNAYNGRADLHACDLGTGSGCIAIALARALPFLNIEAVDISRAALDVAAQNATALNVNILVEQGDILGTLPATLAPYDFIVSNPPYIAASEGAEMEARVKDFEPQTALFVPDDDPLRFYRAIVTFAGDSLKSDGRFYFEINPLYASQLRKMCMSQGFSCDIIPDSFGKQRFAVCNRL